MLKKAIEALTRELRGAYAAAHVLSRGKAEQRRGRVPTRPFLRHGSSRMPRSLDPAAASC